MLAEAVLAAVSHHLAAKLKQGYACRYLAFSVSSCCRGSSPCSLDMEFKSADLDGFQGPADVHIGKARSLVLPDTGPSGSVGGAVCECGQGWPVCNLPSPDRRHCSSQPPQGKHQQLALLHAHAQAAQTDV